MTVHYATELFQHHYIPENAIYEKPLWYHKRGLMQTSTGYGRKLVTSKMLKIGKRSYRIYCHCFSNIGTCYIISKKQHYVVDL